MYIPYAPGALDVIVPLFVTTGCLVLSSSLLSEYKPTPFCPSFIVDPAPVVMFEFTPYIPTA